MNLSRCQVISLMFISVLTILFFLSMYTCSGNTCFGQFISTPAPALTDVQQFLRGEMVTRKFNQSVLDHRREMNLEGEDVFVYLHVQKTGGSAFGRRLVHDLKVDPPCVCSPGTKKCDCFTRNNRIWLFSRHSLGWKCGLHADWTELNDCVDPWFQKNDDREKRRYHVITFIRDPVNRFLSEWQHVQRGATWKSARLFCNGREATLEEVPFCFNGSDWSGVTFEEFSSCEYNLAFNRMTRMLSDLAKVNCYNRSKLEEEEVNEALLSSAKEHLENFAFFGVLEYQRETQFLFERTFGINFSTNFEQRESTRVNRLLITDEMRNVAVKKNVLDISLYLFAKDLFWQRVKTMEKLLGYTVADYFDHIRKVDPEEQARKRWYINNRYPPKKKKR